MKSEGIDVIGFGAGEPDFDTPDHIKEAAIKSIEEGFTKYTPAAGIPDLKKAISAKLKKENGLDYNPTEIVISNGAKHSLDNIFAALLDPGDEVIIPAPYWVSYPEMVKLNDGIPVYIETNSTTCFKITVDQLKETLTSKTKALILNSPSNPTGQVYSREELKKIAKFAVENNVFIISDEVYEKIIYDQVEHVSIASLGEEIKKITAVVNAVSKTYSMTGWRIGYTATPQALATAMGDIQSHLTSNANSIAQKASLAAITGSQDCVEVMRKAFLERRDYMVNRVKEIPLLDCLTPQGSFYLFVEVGAALGKSFRGEVINDVDQFAQCLLTGYQVALVPGSGFGSPDCVRLSFATSMENIQEGLKRIEAFARELS
ncbi:pyridoxal phosphate-dependent aminotransferase [Candidatus Contubernalis alkalaceticus]|nr:pyridoxal phosphate-dependent aminotransferase [Candidatus Contubernalis alkalaceticus]